MAFPNFIYFSSFQPASQQKQQLTILISIKLGIFDEKAKCQNVSGQSFAVAGREIKKLKFIRSPFLELVHGPA